jgi:hypothetical protein
MHERRLGLLVALASIALGLGMRFLFVHYMDFGAADLLLYESRSYGVDLPEWYGERPFFLAWSRGDGQAYVTLAADPWAQGPAREMTPALYRYSRVGYAWAARVAGLLQTSLIPVGLLAVNLGALGYLGWVAGSRLRRWGPRALALALSPGAYIAFVSDTAEALGLALVTGAVLASTLIPGMASGLLLGLVRPDFATAIFRGRRPWALLMVVAGSAIAIRLLGFVVLDLDWAVTDGTLTVPFGGYLDALPQQSLLPAAITVGLLLVAVLTTLHGVTARESVLVRLAYLLTGGFVLLLSSKVLIDPMNSLRAAAALSLVWAIPSEGPRSRTAAEAT